MKLDDNELILRAQQGQTAAFEELVKRYDHQVLSMATSYTGDADESKDIYQEVFLRVYRSLSGFQFRSEFSTWLYRIVTNVCISHQMKRKRQATQPLETDIADNQLFRSNTTPLFQKAAISPESHAQNVEIRQHIQTALEALSPQQKMVFTLKHFQGYKLREIAEMMECGEGTVKKYLFTATDRLRKKLKRIL